MTPLSTAHSASHSTLPNRRLGRVSHLLSRPPSSTPRSADRTVARTSPRWVRLLERTLPSVELTQKPHQPFLDSFSNRLISAPNGSGRLCAARLRLKALRSSTRVGVSMQNCDTQPTR